MKKKGIYCSRDTINFPGLQKTVKLSKRRSNNWWNLLFTCTIKWMKQPGTKYCKGRNIWLSSNTTSTPKLPVFLMPSARRILLSNCNSSNFEPLPMVPFALMKQQTGESNNVWGKYTGKENGTFRSRYNHHEYYTYTQRESSKTCQGIHCTKGCQPLSERAEASLNLFNTRTKKTYIQLDWMLPRKMTHNVLDKNEEKSLGRKRIILK